MYPNQQYPGYGQTGSSPYPPYPQQSPQNMAGAQQNNAPYSIGAGFVGGQQSNMQGSQGHNPGGFGGSGNPYGQSTGNPYGPSSGNPNAPGGPGGYPPSGQQSYGNNPYGSNSSGPGSRYPPPQGGGYPSQGGGYPPQSGGYPPQGGGYPPQSGGYPPQGGGYPQQGGGYPPQSGGYPPQSGGYPPQSGGYPPQSGGYPQQPGGYEPRPSGYPPQGGGYPGQPPQGGFMSNDQRAQQLNQLAQRYEISPQIAARLNILANCEIVLLCDDSGSMNTPLQGTNQSRWDELKSVVNTVVDIGAVMDSNGIDVYFLNRDPMLNVNNGQTVRHVFNSPPQGLTPLVPALRKILAAKRSLTYEKKLLILIATDGAPTNDHGQIDIGTLEAVLRNERTPQTYITFLACTDDLQAVNYLSNWDKSMPNLDVIDDYRSERAEIQQIRGPSFPFSFGDYIVKSLLGSIDPWFDSLDERA
ncbi:unnamed protein product [Rotaria socialis]|uniref:VWFA domain-containing protein n=1 Tax=Rotaria socialis TaxID=392032 RepID=A0A820KRD0_9BILA|nr:unnamed protein product [Rotaria socialis]CAF3215288.1 unnamed protein product [Rotaria socialis]CAF3582594.1 unnamed protein product [Rotaria socialis]CAF4341162.1 unnamed protein product [Rotaria socialis]CAF4499865.1 unnamed protein product [Rotaria socialis]